VHHHGSEDAFVVDWSEAASRLAKAAGTDAGWYAAVAAELVTAHDRVAVDVGCGGAGMATALAAAMAGGRVLAVDGDGDVLAAAEERLAGVGALDSVRRAGRGAEAESWAKAVAVEFVLDDLGGDLATTRAGIAGAGADVVWAAEAVHHAGDQQRAVDRLAGLLAPGGRLALAEGGLPVRRLPWDVSLGEPGLEFRLDVAQNEWFTQMRRRLPGVVPMPYGWPAALRRAGLTDVRTRSWLFEAPTPLAPAEHDRIVHELEHRVDRLRPTGLLDRDLAAWDRLLDESDPAWLGHRDDLQRLTARSVHIGHLAR